MMLGMTASKTSAQRPWTDVYYRGVGCASTSVKRSEIETSEDGDDGDGMKYAEDESTTVTRYPLRRSISDAAVGGTRSCNEEGTTRSIPISVRFEEEENQSDVSQSLTSLHPSRPTAQRSISTPQVGLRSRYHDPNTSSIRLQRRGVVQSNRSPRPRRVRAHKPDPDTPMILPKAKPFYTGRPLKPCMKKKSKSATTTPPNEDQASSGSYASTRALRRVKTVDFEENSSRPVVSVLSLTSASMDTVDMTATQTTLFTTHTNRPKKTVHIASSPSSCPSTISTVKSSPAGPAVTRTDVHVIAIAPSWNASNIPTDHTNNNNDPATPTMQVVESENGRYEVVWEDIPSSPDDQDNNICTCRRRRSSAGHALELLSPPKATATRGLERVNSKLLDWSGTWNTASERFKPTIVVFPDEDAGAVKGGRDCAAEDDSEEEEEEEEGEMEMERVEMVLAAPPNSQMTSKCPSLRGGTRPGSPAGGMCAGREEREERESSPYEVDDDGDDEESEQDLQYLSTQQQQQHRPLPVSPHHPNDTPTQPDSHHHHRLAPSSSSPSHCPPPPTPKFPTELPATRTFSNLSDADLNFRTHRDSVIIAHSRLPNSRVAVQSGSGREKMCMGRKMGKREEGRGAWV